MSLRTRRDIEGLRLVKDGRTAARRGCTAGRVARMNGSIINKWEGIYGTINSTVYEWGSNYIPVSCINILYVPENEISILVHTHDLEELY